MRVFPEFHFSHITKMQIKIFSRALERDLSLPLLGQAQSQLLPEITHWVYNADPRKRESCETS